MIALRRLLKGEGIHLNQRTIQERRKKHEIIINPVDAFIKFATDEFSIESDYVTKEAFYAAYRNFCKYHNLPIEQKETFGKILKKKHNFNEGRESSGERRTIWKGVKLAPLIDRNSSQEILLAN